MSSERTLLIWANVSGAFVVVRVGRRVSRIPTLQILIYYSTTVINLI